MKIITAVCKEILFYSQWWLQEADFLKGGEDNDGDGKVAEGDSNDGGDDDDAGGGDGKTNGDCDDNDGGWWW